MFNPRCWTRRSIAPLIATLLLTGCETVAVSACPAIADYSPEFQARAADQLATLPEGSPVVVMILDYLGLRDQVRACR